MIDLFQSNRNNITNNDLAIELKAIWLGKKFHKITFSDLNPDAQKDIDEIYMLLEKNS